MMRSFFAFVTLCLFISINSGWANSSEDGTVLYMPDGQLQSHMVRVYLSEQLTDIDKKNISLTLYKAAPDKKRSQAIEPVAIDPNHAWSMTVKAKNLNDIEINKVGTLMLFNLQSYDIAWYKAATRIRPEVKWCETDATGKQINCKKVISAKEVNLGNSRGAYGWAAISVLFLIILLGRWAQKVHGKAIWLLCDKSGKLSLSRTQMALWTVAIGGIVEAFALTRYEVPEIPTTLLALMGASLLTTGITYAQPPTQAVSDKQRTPAFGDLICDGPGNNISLARAQMVFWTVITLGMFVSKSLLDGALWHVPVELVGLMGMSQVAYLAPKLKDKTTALVATPPAPPAG